MASYASCMSDYMEAVARKQRLEPPSGYGYKADVALGVGCWLDEQTGCKVLEKPICVPSGQRNHQGYVVLYAYCQQAGMVSILEGQLPPMLPATSREPRQFMSLAAIADNFGNKDPQAATANSEYCVVFRVPSELASRVDTPNRDLWLIRFDQDLVSPFLQAVKGGNVEKVKQGLKHFKGDVADEDGVTALMMAAMGGWEETCQALLGGGADANAAEPGSGRTPLMFAAQGGHSKAVGLLLAAQADASKADHDGATPLMWAAIAGKVEVARQLLPVSDRAAVNVDSLTALQLAEKMKHSDAISALS